MRISNVITFAKIQAFETSHKSLLHIYSGNKLIIIILNNKTILYTYIL